jgi:hypothetical protein
VSISAAKREDPFPTETVYDLTDTCNGVNDKHHTSGSLPTTVSGANFGISTILLGKVYRVTGDSWVGTTANAPALLHVDFHYQIDRPGSRSEITK